MIEKVISKDLSNYIEGLMYETNARKDLLAYMVSKGLTETEAFNKYHTEYVEYHSKYELAKKDITDTFVRPEHPTAKWNLNFDTHTLKIEVPNEG